MKGGLRKIAFVVTSTLLFTLTLKTGAAPLKGAALLFGAERRDGLGVTKRGSSVAALGQLSPSAPLPFAARFRLVEGRGLLVNVWINETGPYQLAIDTGAGATILSERVAESAGVRVQAGRRTTIGGLSGARTGTGREAVLRSLAIGDKKNYLPAQSTVIVAAGLPAGVDGVLDPTESYRPLGYTIDFPQGTISAFDPRSAPLRTESVPAGGAVVAWISGDATRRPFIRLENGRRALIDTGSGFGLALSQAEAQNIGLIPRGRRSSNEVRDLGGGRVMGHRVSPTTIRIGGMTLRNVPTDLLYGVEAGAPILLGRDALYPFKISFDPLNRLVSIAPR
jgi:predicted aspartyl protease